MVEAGESNLFRLLKPRKLLILRYARIARNAKIAQDGYAAVTWSTNTFWTKFLEFASDESAQERDPLCGKIRLGDGQREFGRQLVIARNVSNVHDLRIGSVPLLRRRATGSPSDSGIEFARSGHTI